MAKADYVVDVDQKRTENLTKTEWKIINEVDGEVSNKEIAENLNLSEGTVTELFEWDIKQIRVQRQNAIGNLGSTEIKYNKITGQ